MTCSLSGSWHYSTEDRPEFARSDFDDADWQTMHIPQNWFLGGLDHHGVVWFRREFIYETEEEYISLHFDGVDYFAEVYLNDRLLGRHTGYFEPFTFDITETAEPVINRLAVRVESPFEQPGLNGWHIRKRLIKGVLNHHDCRPGGGWNPEGQSYNTGGIWNNVRLEQHGAVTIENVLLRAELENQPPVLNIQVKANNRAVGQKAGVAICCDPENFNGKRLTIESEIELPAGESSHTVRLPVQDIRLWQPWDRGFPHLYQITTTLSIPGKKSSAVSLFGFRTIKLDEGFRWFVNGQPYFIRGSNYIGSQWLSETLFTEAATSKTHPFGGGAGDDFFFRDVALARQANLNLLRVHAHVLPPEFHTACDRAGMLVWQDFPLQWGYSDEPDFKSEAARQMHAMVTLLYNHPSIAAWCCHNESPWNAPWMAGAVGGTYDPGHNRELDLHLQKIAKQIDPDRYAHLSSGTGDGHVYPGWYQGHWRDYRDLPGAPFISEYGAQGLPARESLRRMLPQFGADAGFAELSRLKTWFESNRKVSSITRFVTSLGLAFFRFMEKHPSLKSVKGLFMEWAMRRDQTAERSIYQKLPATEETPADLQNACHIWRTWQFHNTQLMETFENGIKIGNSLDEFILNSQAYQAHLIQYGTECYRRAKYAKVTGIIQFDFTDPWPAVTWSVLDYWRQPKAAFEALQRSMQPVLPSLILPEKIKAGKATLASFWAVNDMENTFPAATCSWRLSANERMVTSDSFPINIPSDGVSEKVTIAIPALNPGDYNISITLFSSGKPIGKNHYDIVVNKFARGEK